MQKRAPQLARPELAGMSDAADLTDASADSTTIAANDSPTNVVASIEAQIADLRLRLPALEGKAHKKERTRLNKEIYALENGDDYVGARSAIKQQHQFEASAPPLAMPESKATEANVPSEAVRPSRGAICVTMGSSSTCGTHTAMNQDRACTLHASGVWCAAVFDGHSQWGEVCTPSLEPAGVVAPGGRAAAERPRGGKAVRCVAS